MVNIDRELVANALESAPSEFVLHGRSADCDVTLGGDHVAFVCVGGAPHISDLDRGKRPATLEDTRNIIRLSEHFDVIHLQSPNVESQDIPVHLRHYRVTESQLIAEPQTVFYLFARHGAGRRRLCDDAHRLWAEPAGIRGKALVLHHHQHQLTPPARYPHVPGHHRLSPAPGRLR